MRRALIILLVFTLAAACGDDDTSVPTDDLADLVYRLTDDEIDLLLEDVSDRDYNDALDALDAGDLDVFVEYVDENLLAELLGLDDTAADQTSPVATGASPTPTADSRDVRVIDGGSGDPAHEVAIDVQPGDMSFLAWARSAGTSDEVWVTSVVDPRGDDVLADLGLDDGTFSNFGEAAIVMPLDPGDDLEPGTWTIRFESDGSTVASGGIVRSGDPDTNATIDVTVWLVTDDSYDIGDLGDALRRAGNDVFAGNGIDIGRIAISEAPADVVRRFGDIPVSDDDPVELPQKDLCRAMSSTFTDRSLLVAVIDRVVDDDPDGVIEGNASGLPGTVMVPGSGLSCVIVAGDPDPDEPGRGLFERTVVLWHEVGHHLGLFHTSEATGDAFDILGDTAECDLDGHDEGDGYVDSWECDDGANFMFHDSDGTDMSRDQAATVRRHPLLHASG